MIDFSISLSFKFKQYKNVNAVKFVYYLKTQLSNIYIKPYVDPRELHDPEQDDSNE